MVNRISIMTLVICATFTPGAWGAEEEKYEEERFPQCFLYEGTDGKIWLGEPLVSLGMIGVEADHPLYRLSPALAKRFAPLVNRFKDTRDGLFYHWWRDPSRIPLIKEQGKPTVLVYLVGVKVRLLGHYPPKKKRKLYEIVAADLVHAEFITPR